MNKQAVLEFLGLGGYLLTWCAVLFYWLFYTAEWKRWVRAIMTFISIILVSHLLYLAVNWWSALPDGPAK